MKPNEYLQAILKDQTLSTNGDELEALRKHRADVEKLLKEHFSESTPTIRYGGSKAKGTMILESFDLDITCYFPHSDDEAGETLEQIYSKSREALETDYYVEQKASAIRLKDRTPETFAVDFHIDVVPGRFIDDSKTDVFLHRTTGDKTRLKTNLQVHIDHIKDSGLVDAIRLLKLWKVRNGLLIKTFVLELLAVKLLAKRKSSGLSTQLEHIWTECRDNAANLAVEDPANSNNDLKDLLDESCYHLSTVASTSLSLIETIGWEAVFGQIETDDESRTNALKSAAVHTSQPTKPWCRR